MTNEEAADALKRLIYPTHAPYHNEVIRLAIAALRTPPATGAAAMRVAAAKVAHDAACEYQAKGDHVSSGLCEWIANAIRALPAPEVPDQMATFGTMVWNALKDRIGHGEMDETDADNAEFAVKAGLAEHVHYDPEKHGDVQDASPGDKIVWWGDK